MRELVAQGLVTEAEEMLDQAGRGEDDRIVEGSVGGDCKDRVGGGWEAGLLQGGVGGGPRPDVVCEQDDMLM